MDKPGEEGQENREENEKEEENKEEEEKNEEERQRGRKVDSPGRQIDSSGRVVSFMVADEANSFGEKINKGGKKGTTGVPKKMLHYVKDSSKSMVDSEARSDGVLVKGEDVKMENKPQRSGNAILEVDRGGGEVGLGQYKEGGNPTWKIVAAGGAFGVALVAILIGLLILARVRAKEENSVDQMQGGAVDLDSVSLDSGDLEVVSNVLGTINSDNLYKLESGRRRKESAKENSFSKIQSKPCTTEYKARSSIGLASEAAIGDEKTLTTGGRPTEASIRELDDFLLNLSPTCATSRTCAPARTCDEAHARSTRTPRSSTSGESDRLYALPSTLSTLSSTWRQNQIHQSSYV